MLSSVTSNLPSPHPTVTRLCWKTRHDTRRCWCAGCDLTNFGTNTDYDRHGEGTCNTPCAGDSSTLCGGDNAFSLFNTGTCGECHCMYVGTGERNELPIRVTLRATFLGSNLLISIVTRQIVSTTTTRSKRYPCHSAPFMLTLVYTGLRRWYCVIMKTPWR